MKCYMLKKKRKFSLRGRNGKKHLDEERLYFAMWQHCK